jgi:hypothetical protein
MAKPEVSAEMAQQLEDASAAWLEMAIRELKASAKNKKVELSGETIASIDGSISAFSAEAVGQILINFQNSGRFQDWRTRPDYNNQAPVDVLEEWVKKIGINKFKSIPGYAKGKTPISESAAARRIAWGIAVSRLNRGPQKRKRWFAKLMYGPLLARLIAAQIEVMGTSSLRVITENFKIEEE